QNNLAELLDRLGRLDEAIATYTRVLALDPNRAETQNRLGNLLANRGRIEDALTCLRRASALKPDVPEPASNLLYALHVDPGQDAQALLAEHRRWDDRFACPLARDIAPHGNTPVPDRRLRVGYVSPNFRDHVIGHNLRPLLREHDHQQFEVVCYSDVVHDD